MKKFACEPDIIFADDFRGFGAGSLWRVAVGKFQTRLGGKCQVPSSKFQRTAALGKSGARLKREVLLNSRVGSGGE